MKPLLLMLCSGNSCRSHLTEGMLRRALGDRWESEQLWIETGGLCPTAGRPCDGAG